MVRGHLEKICDFFTIPTHALKSQVRSEKSHVLFVLMSDFNADLALKTAAAQKHWKT